MVFFFFKQKTAYEIGVRLVGSEMCIRDSYCYSAVYLYGKKIYFFDKRRKRNIGLENKVGIKAALGNTVYAFFDENDNKLFEIQMKKKNASELMQLIKNEISNRNP